MSANVQYITNDSGQKTAVIVPLEEWENLVEKIKLYEEEGILLSPEDEEDRKQAFAELERGDCLNLRETIKT